jgi:tol-pal system protein YbgF
MIGDIMKKKFGLLIAIASMAVLTGCATRRQAIEIQMQLDDIKANQTALRAENARLDSLFRSNVEQSRKLNADFSTYVSQLDEHMQMVESRLEDAVTLISRAAGTMESGPGQRPIVQPDTSKQDTTIRKPAGIDCQKMYNTAYGDFVQERFDMAITGFKGYVQNCSNAVLVDKAQYWIGESYLSMKQYDKAQQAFETMIQKYPNSERLAAAKLKLGRALYEQRQKAKARQYFEDVIKNYPGTDEAQEAAQMLQRYR